MVETVSFGHFWPQKFLGPNQRFIFGHFRVNLATEKFKSHILGQRFAKFLRICAPKMVIIYRFHYNLWLKVIFNYDLEIYG